MTTDIALSSLQNLRCFAELVELKKRLKKPQRHRLLHGYPLAAAMPERKPDDEFEVQFQPETGRGLLVGVLPHPYCNPSVTGCGFCTFPHQKYQSDKANTVVAHVVGEIEQRLERQPKLHKRKVAALYIGGGTANLTPPDAFRLLCQKLAETFDLSNAEVTLEGAPIYFLKRKPLLVDILREEIPARHFRISMGIQTFDEKQLDQMGRRAFGNEETFREVVELAHERGFTASGDLLFDLPHQSLEQMKQDVARAVDIGLDHLGLYHLVIFAGLGTPWSRDSELLAGLPSNDFAVENWLALQQMLFDSGFHQTTLTNFERNDFADDPRRFQYEELSFQPHEYEMLGFGPGGISFAADAGFRSALKTLNPISADEYVAAVASKQGAWNRSFFYGTQDLRIFYLTRRLAATKIDRREFKTIFGSDPMSKFSREFSAMQSEDLIRISETSIEPTLMGMFYGDTIAALLAWRKLQARREKRRERLHALRHADATIPAKQRATIYSDRPWGWLQAFLVLLIIMPFLGHAFILLVKAISIVMHNDADAGNDNAVAHM